MPAVTVSLTIARATEAPTPTFFVVTASFAGSAFVVVDEVDVAVSETLPVPAFAIPKNCACVSRMITAIATEPATPTLPAPAPDVASVSNVCVLSVPTDVIDASSVRPVEVTVEPAAIVASFVTCA